MILPKASLVTNILAEIKDNSTGNISPLDVRQNLLNIIDSVHLLTEGHDLKADNFETLNTRSTRVGDGAIKKLDLSGYVTVDNTAVGYESLRENYSGERNVSLGTMAVCCNIHGDDNIGLGTHAVAGNTIGSANIGIGSYTLNDLKTGDFNIAIGHGAGYYIGKDDSYKFYLGQHPITAAYICNNPAGSNMSPLLIGDLKAGQLKLGIGMKTLRDDAMLQVAGDIAPDKTLARSLGSETYRFRDAYLHERLLFSDSTIFFHQGNERFQFSHGVYASGHITAEKTLKVEDKFTCDGLIRANSGINTFDQNIFFENTRIAKDFVPTVDRKSNLGSSAQRIFNIYTQNIFTDGIGRFTKFESLSTSHFFNKVINLASSGANQHLDGGNAAGVHGNSAPADNEEFAKPYLSDEDIDGAGLKLSSSGVSYTRDYSLLFKSPDSYLSAFEGNIYNRTYWTSNIGLRTAPDGNVHTRKVINRDVVGLYSYDVDNTSDLYYGVTVSGDKLYVSKTADSFLTNGEGSVNFINDTNNTDEYIITTAAQEDDVNITHRLISNSSKEDGTLNGFDLSYISDSDLTKPEFFNEKASQYPNRFVIKSYHDSSVPKRTFTFMQDATDGQLGVSNFDNSENMIPDTAINVRSTGNAIIRTTAENLSNTEAALQLFTRENCDKYGAEFTYSTQKDTLDVVLYNNSTKNTLFSTKSDTAKLAVFGNDGVAATDMLTLGGSGNKDAIISMFHVSNQPTETENYAKLYSKATTLDGQKSLLMYLDTSGNYFNVDMTPVSADSGESQAKPLFVDAQRNTLGGAGTPETLDQITTAVDNTAIGYHALRKLITGSKNTVVGSQSMKEATDTSENVILGCHTNTTGDGNIIIGHNVQSTMTDCLDIGHNGKRWIQGYNNANWGRLLEVPSETDISVAGLVLTKLDGSTDSVVVHEKGKSIRFGETSTSSPDGAVALSSFLTSVDIDNNGLHIHDSRKLILEDSGSSIQFGDNTTLDSSSFLNDIATNASNISSNDTDIASNHSEFTSFKNDVNGRFIEGFAKEDINTASNGGATASIGAIEIREQVNGQWVKPSNSPVHGNQTDVNVHNRDPYLRIKKGDFVVAIKINGEYRPVWSWGNPNG